MSFVASVTGFKSEFLGINYFTNQIVAFEIHSNKSRLALAVLSNLSVNQTSKFINLLVLGTLLSLAVLFFN